MIEVPSAAITAEQLAGEVDFFSLGTNDLVQYTLAVDRGTARVAELYQPPAPGRPAPDPRRHRGLSRGGIPTTICGEMAADPVGALLLMGLGVRHLSVSPPQIRRSGSC